MSGTAAQRITAPFGARIATVTARAEHGAYVVLACVDPVGPRPQAGQFYMLMAADRWGGGAGERPFLPRAFSVLRAPADTDSLEFLVEDVGPGTNRLCELGPGDGLSLVGPLGNGFARPRDGRRALLVGGGVGIAPLAIWQDQLGAAATVLLGFRDTPHAKGAELLARRPDRNRRWQCRASRPRHGSARRRARFQLLRRGVRVRAAADA